MLGLHNHFTHVQFPLCIERRRDPQRSEDTA
jgi:hypothetical protein